jgi:hypothetical protein
VEAARAGLDALQLAPPSHAYSRDVLHQLSRLCAAYDAGGFETRAETAYPDRRQFRRAVELAIALTDRADGLSGLITMLAYIEAAAIPQTDATPPLHELTIDRELVRQRLSPAAVSRGATLVDDLRPQFDVFQRRYGEAYLAHHAAYQEQAAAQAPALITDVLHARALGLLNGISALGPPLGQESIVTQAKLASDLRPCGLSLDALAEALAGETICPGCGLRLDAILPSAALANAREQLRLALEQQRRRLAQAIVARAAANDGRPVIDRFLRAVQAADLAPLVEILDETTLTLIEELLSDA